MNFIMIIHIYSATNLDVSAALLAVELTIMSWITFYFLKIFQLYAHHVYPIR